jgi:AP-3 complex subunit beta
VTSNSTSAFTIIERLAYHIEEMRHPQARACVIWLVGQYAEDGSPKAPGMGIEGVAGWAPDVLRRTAKSFREEVSWAWGIVSSTFVNL